jgi:type IV secretion system protein VirB6
MMACPTIITGDVFLTRVLAHIDCQAQAMGTYGYQALGQAEAPGATVATGLLTLFIALFGIRLLFGPAPGARDVVYDVLKIGIVLTLAFSWPAFHTLVYDVVVDGPAELATAIAGSGEGQAMLARLQGVDSSIVRLIETGTGRYSGQFLNQDGPGSTFAGTGLQDDAAFGWSRLLFLGSTIGSIGLLRLLAGVLLALAPVMAALLLFEATRGLFAGWLRGLVLAMLGMLGVSVVLVVELAMIEPWLVDALRVRALGYATPATPIELFAMTFAFTVLQLTMIWLLAKVAFYRGWPTIPRIELPAMPDAVRAPPPVAAMPGEGYVTNRARRISDSVETLMRREEQGEVRRLTFRDNDRGGERAGTIAAEDGAAGRVRSSGDRLGDSYRRTSQRGSAASRSRDLNS